MVAFLSTFDIETRLIVVVVVLLIPVSTCGFVPVMGFKSNKKLSYRRGTARCVVSVEILPVATQQCRNYLYDKS